MNAQSLEMLRIMKRKGYITNKQANDIGIRSPTRRIVDLNQGGYIIGSSWVRVPTRYSARLVRIKRYYLQHEPTTKKGKSK